MSLCSSQASPDVSSFVLKRVLEAFLEIRNKGRTTTLKYTYFQFFSLDKLSTIQKQVNLNTSY